MKCAVYIRVSTDNEEQKTSLVNQKSYFVDFIQKNNYDLYDFYEDVESGTTEKRENLQRLLKDAENKKFDIILTKEISRLARNVETIYKIKKITENNNIGIYTADNSFNTLTNNTGMLGLWAWIAENESQKISERVKIALNSKAKRGEMKGSNAPFGYYKKDCKLYKKDDFTVDIVKKIFSDYLSGKGLDTIARELTKSKVITPAAVNNKKNRGTVWHGRTIQLILQNKAYIGHLVQSKQESISVTNKKRRNIAEENQIIVKNSHEPIISKDDFNLAQQLLKTRAKNKIRPLPNSHLFSNLLFCADCGKGMHYKANRKGYVCGSYDKWGKLLCSSHIVREKDLINIIKNDINTIISKQKQTDSLDSFKIKIQQKEKEFQNENKNLKVQIDALTSRKVNCLKKFIDNLITKEEYDLIVADTSTNLINFNNKISKNEAILKKFKNANIPNFDFKKITKIDKGFLTKIVNKIEVKENGDLKIDYKFSNPF